MGVKNSLSDSANPRGQANGEQPQGKTRSFRKIGKRIVSSDGSSGRTTSTIGDETDLVDEYPGVEQISIDDLMASQNEIVVSPKNVILPNFEPARTSVKKNGLI